jgi:putative ABC transport system permease protein
MHPFRALRRSPGFAFTVIATLALAIGANTAVFSLINFTMFAPLPYPDADRIVQLWFTTPNGDNLGFSETEFNALLNETGIFQEIAGYDFAGPGINLTGDGEPEQVKGIRVSRGYFPIFASGMQAGRAFTADEDRPKAGRVVVLSHELWRRRYGADPNLVGRSVSLGNEPYTVVGIAAAGFRSDPPAQLWLPLQVDPNSSGFAHYMRVAARLRPGIEEKQANARLKLTFQDYRRKYPLINSEAGFAVKPFRETRAGDWQGALLVLGGTVLLVLLIACSNVANLQLARAVTRRREIAVRAALGATRIQLAKHVLLESLLLSIAGGILGLAVGRLCLLSLVALNPDSIPGGAEFANAALDWRVLTFTAAVCIAATILGGLLPALRGSQVDLVAPIHTGPAQTGTRSALVVVQIALATMLLTGAGLMIRTFAALRNVDPGIDTGRVLTLEMSLHGKRFSDTDSVDRLVAAGVERLRGVPGVSSAATTWTLPVELAFGAGFTIEGRPLGKEIVHGPTMMRPVSSGFADVFRLPVKSGRFFDARDSASGSVAVISEAMARKYWPEQDPIGQRISLDKHMGPDFEAPPREIIGVVGDVRDMGLNKEPAPLVYQLQAQLPDGMTRIDRSILTLTWVVRTEVADPYTLSGPIREQLRLASGGLAVGRVRSMRDVVRQSTAQSDFNSILLTAFAGVAMLLAAVGVYGLISFSVQQRRRELGIRMALGATPEQVRAMVVGSGARLAGVGVIAGVLGSLDLTRYMESILFGVAPTDPAAIGVACLTLGAVAVAAAYVPARKAARVDPAEVLRST